MDRRLNGAIARAMHVVGLRLLVLFLGVIAARSANAGGPLPCTDSFTKLGQPGNWFDPNNWSNAAVPGPSAVACFIASGTGTFYVDASTTVRSLVIGSTTGTTAAYFGSIGLLATGDVTFTATDTVQIVNGSEIGFNIGTSNNCPSPNPVVTLAANNLNVAAGATIQGYSGSCGVTQDLDVTNGTIAGSISIPKNTTIFAEGGELTFGPNGVLAGGGILAADQDETLNFGTPNNFTAGLNNSGVVNVGGSDVLKLTSFTQGPDGTTVENATSGPTGPVNSFLSVNGPVSLGGTLHLKRDVELKSGSLTLVVGLPVSGTFSSVVVDGCSSDKYFISYLSNLVSLLMLGDCPAPPAAPTGTPTVTPTNTPVPTVTSSPSSTATRTQTAIPTETLTPTETPTPTETDTPTPSDTPTETPLPTDTPKPPTASSTPSHVPTTTSTPTSTPSKTRTATPTAVFTATIPATNTPTALFTATVTVTKTITPTPPFTPTAPGTTATATTVTPMPSLTPTPKRGDANCDGSVSAADTVEVIKDFGVEPPPCGADVNGDGVVDGEDLDLIVDEVFE